MENNLVSSFYCCLLHFETTGPAGFTIPVKDFVNSEAFTKTTHRASSVLDEPQLLMEPVTRGGRYEERSVVE